MPEMFRLLDSAQLQTAREAMTATPLAMASLDGVDRLPEYAVDPRQWVGVNGNGMNTIDVMWGAVVKGKRVVSNVGSTDIALHVIEMELVQRSRTLLADTQRSAAMVAGRSRYVHCGYVRGLTPPSCGRCVVLAGRPCGSEPFERHPNCDCIAIPTSKTPNTAVTSANEYLDGLSDGQLAKTLGSRANARAWKDGADLNQLVNAYRRSGSVSAAQLYGRNVKYTTEGMTKRGLASSRMISAGYAKDYVKRVDVTRRLTVHVSCPKRFTTFARGPARIHVRCFTTTAGYSSRPDFQDRRPGNPLAAENNRNGRTTTYG